MRIKLNKQTIFFLTVLLALSTLVGVCNYIRIPVSHFSDVFAYMVHASIVIATTFGLLYLISINKYVFTILFGPLVFLSLISAYLLYVPNIMFSSAIIDVSLNSGFNVAKEYITGYQIMGIVVAFYLITLIYIYRFRKTQHLFKRRYFHVIISICLIIPGYYVNSKRNNTIMNRVPFVVAGSISEYIEIRESNSMVRQDVGSDAISSCDDTLSVVLVIGEALRNDHLGINGYHRNTTPNLQKLNVIPVTNMRSLYSYTAASVPQLLTRADSLDDARRFEEKSFISIFNMCGFSTEWIANQTPEYTYNVLAKEAQCFVNVSIRNTAYSDKLWTDQNIIDQLKVSDAFKKPKNLVVLHSIGSHWYYNYRFPQEYEIYKPIAKSRSVNHNSPDHLINSYDNTVVFMDYFVSNVIAKIENKNAILIFLSDHGELLGEDGNWLHATDNEVLYDAGCFVWMSEKYKARNPDKYKDLLLNVKNKWDTSFLFHSILSAANISSSVIDEDLNIFNK